MLLVGLGKMIKKVTGSLNLLVSRLLGFTVVTSSGSGYYGSTTVRSLKPAIMLYGSWFQKLSGVITSSKKIEDVSGRSSKTGKFAIGDQYIISISSGVFSYSTDGETWVNQFYFGGDNGGFVAFQDGYYVATDGAAIWIGTDPTSASFTSYNPGNRASTHLYAQARFYNNEILIDGGQGTVVRYSKITNQITAVEISPNIGWVSVKKAGTQYYFAISYDQLPYRSGSNFTSWSTLPMPSGLNLNSYNNQTLEAGTDNFYIYYSLSDRSTQHGRRRAWITYNGGSSWSEEYFGYYVPSGLYDYDQPTLYFLSAGKMQESDNSIQITTTNNAGADGKAWNITPNGVLNSATISYSQHNLSNNIPGTKSFYFSFGLYQPNNEVIYTMKRFDFDTMVEDTVYSPKTDYFLTSIPFFDQQTQQYIYKIYDPDNPYVAELYTSTSPLLTDSTFISLANNPDNIIGVFPTLATYDEVQSSIGNQADQTVEILAPIDVYTVPSDKTTSINQVTIKNNSLNTITYDLGVLDSGVDLTDLNAWKNDQPILPGSTVTVTGSQLEVLQPGQRIVVLPSAVDVVEVKVYGTETLVPLNYFMGLEYAMDHGSAVGMFLDATQTAPAIGSTITISGNNDSDFNQSYVVNSYDLNTNFYVPSGAVERVILTPSTFTQNMASYYYTMSTGGSWI